MTRFYYLKFVIFSFFFDELSTTLVTAFILLTPFTLHIESQVCDDVCDDVCADVCAGVCDDVCDDNVVKIVGANNLSLGIILFRVQKQITLSNSPPQHNPYYIYYTRFFKSVFSALY